MDPVTQENAREVAQRNADARLKAALKREIPECPCGCGIIYYRAWTEHPQTRLEFMAEEWMAKYIRRFWQRVDRRTPEACWPWQLTVSTSGYGVTSVIGQQVYAHRFAYEAAFGPLDEDHVVDHLCRNRICCNPRHLEAVSMAENNRRGLGASGQNVLKTHCPAGHPYNEANTFVREDGGRQCRVCNRDRMREAKRRARGDT